MKAIALNKMFGNAGDLLKFELKYLHKQTFVFDTANKQ